MMKPWLQWELGLSHAGLDDPKVRIWKVSENRTTKGRATSSGAPDFLGVLDGRSVAIEAKTTDRATLPWSSLRAQASQLLAHKQAGGLTYVAARYRHIGSYLVPWEAIFNIYLTRRSGLNAAEALRLGEQIIGYDWHTAARKMENRNAN